MKIETYTYFERIIDVNNIEDLGGGQTYCSIIEEKLSFDLFMKNPTFIEVANEFYDTEIFVINSQEFGNEYLLPIEGVNSWCSDNFLNIGVWKIKYKSKINKEEIHRDGGVSIN